MKESLLTVAKGLVEFPDQVTVEVDEPNEEGVIVYHLHVAESDMSGRSIGKQGRIAKAIRTVMYAVATRNDEKVAVEHRVMQTKKVVTSYAMLQLFLLAKNRRAL